MQGETTKAVEKTDSIRVGKSEPDIIALGIALAAIILFLGTGGKVLPQIIRAYMGTGHGPDQLLVSALLLNIALIIFGWRRYRELGTEIRERRKAEAHARLLSETDPLTGCLNRRSIGAATNQLIEAARERGEIVAFLMLDLDNFKQVNDVNGHIAGDAILQESARRLAEGLPERALIARIGGDEFACVIPFAREQRERIDQIATTLIASVAQPVQIAETTFDITISVGITRSDQFDASTGLEADAMSLLNMADIAMYHAKRHGRNRHSWFDPSMESELRFRSELESGIRRGILHGEFEPYYEQQIDLETGDLVGFEMLARWNSPTLGLVSPEIFIPIAEEIGVIADLSERLIAQALEDAKGWDPKLTLSVNISPVQLRDPWFSHKILKMLVEANFPPARLEIEITESCLHENIGVVRTMIESMKNQGIMVSLDDFGTGYSSLAQLRTLPFDRIKIDRSFVSGLVDNPESATIVQAISAMGAGLGLPITAEGVESSEVLLELQRYGKFKGQGYFYGRPQTAGKTHDTLAKLGLLAGEPLSEIAEVPAIVTKPAKRAGTA